MPYIIVNKGTVIPDKVCLEVGDPYVAYAKVAQLLKTGLLFSARAFPKMPVDPSATIDPSASIGPGSIIGASVKTGLTAEFPPIVL